RTAAGGSSRSARQETALLSPGTESAAVCQRIEKSVTSSGHSAPDRSAVARRIPDLSVRTASADDLSGVFEVAAGPLWSLRGRSVKTFSIGFSIPEYDETIKAREAAQRLGTEHHEFRVEPECASVLEKLVWHYDEPFADSSAIPTYYVSKLTREHVTVALTGD